MKLVLTNRLDHASCDIDLNEEELYFILLRYICTLLNVSTIDDDYSSIELVLKFDSSTEATCNYYLIDHKVWRIENDILLGYHQLVNDWLAKLKNIEACKWIFSNINKLALESLEELFGRTMRISSTDNHLTLVLFNS